MDGEEGYYDEPIIFDNYSTIDFTISSKDKDEIQLKDSSSIFGLSSKKSKEETIQQGIIKKGRCSDRRQFYSLRRLPLFSRKTDMEPTQKWKKAAQTLPLLRESRGRNV